MDRTVLRSFISCVGLAGLSFVSQDDRSWSVLGLYAASFFFYFFVSAVLSYPILRKARAARWTIAATLPFGVYVALAASEKACSGFLCFTGKEIFLLAPWSLALDNGLLTLAGIGVALAAWASRSPARSGKKESRPGGAR